MYRSLGGGPQITLTVGGGGKTECGVGGGGGVAEKSDEGGLENPKVSM